MAMAARFNVAILKHDIAARGWVASDLAKAAKVSDMTVSRALRGKVTNPKTWDRFARVMGVPVSRYLKGFAA